MADNLGRETRLTKRLGLTSTTLAGVGAILGAGIYVLVGIAAGKAGNAVWLSFLLAAVGAGLTGFSYARLVRLRPKDAPEFNYVSMAFGRHPGFLAGWLILWAIVISVAVVSLGFAGYLFRLLALPPAASAIGLVIFMMLVLFLGAGGSVAMAELFTIIEVIGLLIIIGISIPYIGRLNYFEMPQGFSGVVSASALAFFVYLGFQDMVNFAEEMRNPERDLPRAIILALVICAFLYVFVSLSAISILGWENLSQSTAPLAQVAARALGAKADFTLAAIALVATANTVLIMLFAASRAMWAMSSAGALPGVFSLVHQKRRTPWLSILLVGLFAGFFIIIGDIESAAQLANFAILIAFSAVNASAIRLSMKTVRNISSRGLVDITLHGAGVLVCLWLASRTGWQAAFLGVGLLLAGEMTYWLISFMSRRVKAG